MATPNIMKQLIAFTNTELHITVTIYWLFFNHAESIHFSVQWRLESACRDGSVENGLHAVTPR